MDAIPILTFTALLLILLLALARILDQQVVYARRQSDLLPWLEKLLDYYPPIEGKPYVITGDLLREDIRIDLQRDYEARAEAIRWEWESASAEILDQVRAELREASEEDVLIVTYEFGGYDDRVH